MCNCICANHWLGSVILSCQHISCAHSWMHSLSPHFLAVVCNYVLPTIGLYVFCVHSLCAFLGTYFLITSCICRVLSWVHISALTYCNQWFVTFIFPKLWFSLLFKLIFVPFLIYIIIFLFCWLFSVSNMLLINIYPFVLNSISVILLFLWIFVFLLILLSLPQFYMFSG